MHDLVLGIHSLLRWVVVILAALALGRALWGWWGQRAWEALDERLGLFFTVSLDVQVLLGLLLYLFLSPITTGAFASLGEAMADPALRFWLIEHIGWMIAALILAHVGRALAKRASEARQKHQRTALFFGLAILAVLIAIPWGRPLLPLG